MLGLASGHLGRCGDWILYCVLGIVYCVLCMCVYDFNGVCNEALRSTRLTHNRIPRFV